VLRYGKTRRSEGEAKAAKGEGEPKLSEARAKQRAVLVKRREAK